MLKLLCLFCKNIKLYNHYISLGYNCEIAYRFFKKCGFVEASLFTWTNSMKIENLIFALNNLDSIFVQEPVLAGVMWRCKNTDIRFHGTEPFEMHQNPEKYTDDDYKPYKEELVSRIKHLREKFITQISDEKKTLLAYSYLTHGENTQQIINNIINIKTSLDNIGAKNYDLLIVLERKDDLSNKAAFFEGKNIYIRYVDEFAPEADVTTKHYDKKSWNKILKEFRPNFKLKKKKKFKFEEI